MEGEEELEARGSRLEPCLPGALKEGRKEGRNEKAEQSGRIECVLHRKYNMI